MENIGYVGPGVDSVIHLTKINDLEEDEDADGGIQENPFEFNGQSH